MKIQVMLLNDDGDPVMAGWIPLESGAHWDWYDVGFNPIRDGGREIEHIRLDATIHCREARTENAIERTGA